MDHFVRRYPDVSPAGFPYAENPVSPWLAGFFVCLLRGRVWAPGWVRDVYAYLLRIS